MLAQPKRLLPALATLLALLLAASPPQARQPEVNPNVRFGTPADAKADPESREAYLIARPQYVLSYNAKTRTPNWVSWRLRKEDIGNASRGAFQPDPLLPKGVIARVTSHDYDGSGFDRGHQCPAKDRSATQEDCNATFYMTNVVPQSPNSNQRGWERMESYCRDLTRKGYVLYIACGPSGVGGTGKNGYAEEIGKSHKVAVPRKLWKVVLVLPRDDAEPRKNSRVISVIMPNNQSVGFDWPKYRCTARDVEKLTRFRFFRDVPEEVAEALRDHKDTVEVRVPVPKHPKKSGAR
jgi:endonuclease G